MRVQQNLALDAASAGDSNEPANRRSQNRVRRYNQVVPIRVHSWLNPNSASPGEAQPLEKWHVTAFSATGVTKSKCGIYGF